MSDQLVVPGIPPAPTAPPEALVVRTRFVPPRIRPRIVQRPRVEAVLARVTDFPLTVVKAEAGYGKTTAVAAWLAGGSGRSIWFNVRDTEPDPAVFLLHLIHAVRTLHPEVGGAALAAMARAERSPRLWNAVVDALSNELLDALQGDTVLVLDDYDRVNTAEVNAITERLVEAMPPRLHLVITARTMPSLRSRAKWRASGELLEISRGELAFDSDEVAQLFAGRLEGPLTSDAARSVAAETEGWPIALQMLSDSMGGTGPEALDHLLRRIPGPSELLFDYLAEEVFNRQSAETRRFLGETACLRRLDPAACDALLGSTDAAEVLRSLEQRSLFVASDGGQRYHYHNLFADFLQRRAGVSPERRLALHRRAAAWYLAQGDEEEAVYHLLAADEHEHAARTLVRIAGEMAQSGRHQALGAWLDQLPAEVLDRSAELLHARGETCRLASRYAEALPAYERARALFGARGDAAGEVRALRGQALLYLDSVQPARATPLLREAARRTRGDRAERAALYLLIAENELNAGNLRRADRLFRAAHRSAPRPHVTSVDPRLHARAGRFAEARQLVEASRRAEPAVAVRSRAPRSHREPTALLAWIAAMIGDAEGARQHAAEALEVGRALGAPTIEFMSLSRLGFGWLTGHDYDPARARAYVTDALRLAEGIAVPRFKVEALISLTIIGGLEGRSDEAEGAAREALAILDETGDRYMRGLVCVALGGAMVLCERADADRWLREAARQGTECGDQFIPCVATLWLAIHHARAGRAAEAREAFTRSLATASREGYGCLFLGTPLLAPKDPALWRGLLRRAHEHAELGAWARELSRQLDPTAEAAGGVAATEGPATAPLYLQTLGPFRAWRRGQEIERAAWSREKALHLLQLLVCHRGHALHREQILELLWPDSPASTAATGLRVALSALRSALAPDRESGADGGFVRREGEVIRLAPEAGIRVDADEFARQLKSARAVEGTDPEHAIALYESALALYRGEFLSETRYAAWADAERQQRRGEFLASAERLAGLWLKAGEGERAARWAETILQHDPLWEAAYAILMEAHWRQGNRALAVRAYNRCRKRLHDALGVPPSSRTAALLQRISQPDPDRG